MSKELAPVVVYTYSRLKHLQQTVSALQQNYMAKDTILYVISDGPKNSDHKKQINALRNYVDAITGFKEVVRVYRDKNMGALGSVYDAEGRIVSDHGRIISMEDDNISSKNFLNFMNQGLAAYENDENIFSICGYCPPIEIPDSYVDEYWVYHWNLSWGYATWKNKYYKIHPLINNYRDFKREGLLKVIRKMGGLYIEDALLRDYRRKAIFPDAILCAKMTQQGFKSIIPAISKVKNIGSDGSGISKSTLAKKNDVILDDRNITDFSFSDIRLDNDILIKQATKFYNGSLVTRIARKAGIYHELVMVKNKLFGR